MPVGNIDALAWLRSRTKFGIRPGLERTRKTLAVVGNPQDSLSFVHVAGTNGKGSVCAMTASVLSQRVRVGLFVSPGTDGFRGRFFVAGSEMPTETFERLADMVRRASEQATPDDPLTEFEALTVMALCYFREESVDAVVWETGLGGRYDSTNVVTPEVSVITNVSYDHQEVLGHTISEIAFEKAGIIKQGIPVVTGAVDDGLALIERVAAQRSAKCYRSQIDFGTTTLSADPQRQTVFYRGLWTDGVFDIPLFGRHQAGNAGIALAVLEVYLHRRQLSFSSDDIQTGLKQTVWPGRFEVLRAGEQVVVLDGAHNRAGAVALASGLKEFEVVSGRNALPWTFVIGILSDKDYIPMLRSLLPLARRVIVAAPDSPRALPVQELHEAVLSLGFSSVESADSVAQACRRALQGNEPICCCGSLNTVFEARKTMTDPGYLGQI